jgi:hypothetical protein
MFPWARAVVLAARYRLPILAPRWVQPRFGAVMRGEQVKRFYFREFTNRGYIKGVKKALVLLRAERVSEDRLPDLLANAEPNPVVVVFEHWQNYFEPIRTSYELVRRELEKIVAPRILGDAAKIEEPYVAMHIRRGDFRVGDKILVERRLTPLEWYVGVAKALRSNPSWRDLPIWVFTDGTLEDVAELIRQANVRLVPAETAIGDMLKMSKAHLLAASGQSTFSMWASYLGRMPTLYCPGKMQQKVFPEACPIFEGEWIAGDSLPVTSHAK